MPGLERLRSPRGQGAGRGWETSAGGEAGGRADDRASERETIAKPQVWRPVTRRLCRATRSGGLPRTAPTPVGLLEEQDTTREPDLVPVRHGRMMVSPFTFYRGAVTTSRRPKSTPRSRS